MDHSTAARRKYARQPNTARRLSMQYLRRASRRRLAATGALLAMIALAVAIGG
jgi:hypothetical protein